MSKQEDYRRALQAVLAISMESLQGDSPSKERADGDPDSPPPGERHSLWFRAFGKTAFGNQFPSPLFIAAEEEE